MPRLTATKEFSFDCAHMLEGHKGLCKNLHGHTYKLEVTVESTVPGSNVILSGPSEGMVMDFKDLKNVVKELIVDRYDHATVINYLSEDSFEEALHELLNVHEKKIVVVDYRPTAENMVQDFLDIIQKHTIRTDADWRVIKVRLYETPTSYAEVTA